MRKANVHILFGICLLAMVGYAQAADWGPATVRVTTLDATYMGAPTGSAAIAFKVDAAVGGGSGCATYEWLYFSPVAWAGSPPVDNDRQMVNSKAVLSSLQLALVTGTQVVLYGFNKASGVCHIERIINLNS